jgi:hypothetical protein
MYLGMSSAAADGGTNWFLPRYMSGSDTGYNQFYTFITFSSSIFGLSALSCGIFQKIRRQHS